MTKSYAPSPALRATKTARKLLQAAHLLELHARLVEHSRSTKLGSQIQWDTPEAAAEFSDYQKSANFLRDLAAKS